MAESVKIKIQFDAVNRATSAFASIEWGLGKISSKTAVLAERSARLATAVTGAAQKGFMMAAAVQAPAALMTKSFIDAESAAADLKMTLMNKDGVVAGFEEVSKTVEALGAKLPGSVTDFYNMASTLKGFGVETRSLPAALKTTAELATILKAKGVGFAEAAENVAKFKNALRIADKDMDAFADVIQKSAFMGVGDDAVALRILQNERRAGGDGRDGIGFREKGQCAGFNVHLAGHERRRSRFRVPRRLAHRAKRWVVQRP